MQYYHHYTQTSYLEMIQSWRPIFLQGTLYTLYAAVITRRFSDGASTSSSIYRPQKGFQHLDGALKHTVL